MEGIQRIMGELMYATGMRIIELVRLRVKDVDFERNLISIRRAKGDKDRAAPLPPELVADLMYRGIALAGGGALLRGLDRRLAQETKFPVYVADAPLSSVVQGTGEMLEETEMLEKVRASLASRKPPR